MINVPNLTASFDSRSSETCTRHTRGQAATQGHATLRLITAKAAKRLGIEACVTFGISRKILWEPLEVTIFSKIAVPSNNAPNDHRFPLRKQQYRMTTAKTLHTSPRRGRVGRAKRPRKARTGMSNEMC